MINYEGIGKRIREKRKSLGLTQTVLAERAGIEPSNLSHIERAATKLSLPTLIMIANALGATLDELVYDTLQNNTQVSFSLINELLSDCSPSELRALCEVIKTTKAVLRAQG